MLPKNVLYYGKPEPSPKKLHLNAGGISLVYEAGDLRYIKLGNREILRRIYVSVRGQNWITVPTVITNVQTEIGKDSFCINCAGENQQGDIDFAWQGKIIGTSEGKITFSIDGIARSTFLRNRLGFCILHPMRECAGQPCTIEKTDGTREQGVFPEAISPRQPFMDIRAITYLVGDGVWVEMRFDGDTFEMEDQRNWTDASFKTYCTPLDLPKPVEVKAGTTISQSVEISLRGDFHNFFQAIQLSSSNPELTFTLGQEVSGKLPQIGLGVASHGQPLSDRELSQLQALHLSHLRLDLELSQPEYAIKLQRVASEAKALAVSLEIALTLSDHAAQELETLCDLLAIIKPHVSNWLIFHASASSISTQWIELARQYLSPYTPSAKIGTGTNAYFVHLNHNRPPLEALDLVCYSVNPQVHAFDNSSLVETLPAQAVTVESARRFAQGLLIAVTPITFKPRFNPNAPKQNAIAVQPPYQELPPPVDPRQMSLFGAGWTLGSIKYLAEVGTYSVTYYETTGWRGIMELATGSPCPDQFPSLPNSVFPMYHIFADIGEMVSGEVIPSQSSDPLTIEGFTIQKDGLTRILLANFTNCPQTVLVNQLSAQVSVRYLDETNVLEAMRSPEIFRQQGHKLIQTQLGTLKLDLRPYAIARIDSLK